MKRVVISCQIRHTLDDRKRWKSFLYMRCLRGKVRRIRRVRRNRWARVLGGMSGRLWWRIPTSLLILNIIKRKFIRAEMSLIRIWPEGLSHRLYHPLPKNLEPRNQPKSPPLNGTVPSANQTTAKAWPCAKGNVNIWSRCRRLGKRRTSSNKLTSLLITRWIIRGVLAISRHRLVLTSSRGRLGRAIPYKHWLRTMLVLIGTATP